MIISNVLINISKLIYRKYQNKWPLCNIHCVYFCINNFALFKKQKNLTAFQPELFVCALEMPTKFHTFLRKHKGPSFKNHKTQKNRFQSNFKRLF